MLSTKENFLETIKKDGKPDRVVVQWGPLETVFMIDPCMKYTRGMREKGKTVIDRWGTTITWPEDQPAAVPHVTSENKVIKDIENWRNEVKVPDLIANCSTGWEPAQELVQKIHDEDKLAMGFMGTGMFEQIHALMGFEDALMGLLTDPEDMDDLIEAIFNYRCTYAQLLVDNLKIDAICSHDDWGTKTSLFMKPETWREFFKERYRKFYKIFKDAGIIVIHHADSYCEPIAEDMVDVGIDVWQGALYTNDIPAIQKKLGGRMAIMGGIDSGLDLDTTPEEALRAEVRRAMDEYVPGGNFIPNLPNGLKNGAIFPRTDQIIDDEIRKYRGKFFK